jgi:hypothetical protein
LLYGKRGEPPRGSAFTGMGRRRVRWRNVGRVACLLAAGAVIATHGDEAPAPGPSRRLTPVALPRLADVPQLRMPRPRKRRVSKGGSNRGVPSVDRDIRGESTKVPRTADGQLPAVEGSAAPAPTTGEFTPDPGP